MATRDTIGVLLYTWRRVPVHHAPITRRRFHEDGVTSTYEWYTMCGRKVSDYTDPFLRLDHLAKFARPCRRCYPETRNPEVAEQDGTERGER